MLSLALAWPDDVDSRTNNYVRRWMRHFPALRDTCVEAWIEELAPVSLPTAVRQLTADERDLLVEDHWRREINRPGCEPDAFDSLFLGLEELVLQAQLQSPVGAAFVRIGTRAPLDSPLGAEADMQMDGGREALELLLDSPRLFDDMCLFQECGHLPSVVIRPWIEIEPGLELRAFVRGRRLVGLSQRYAQEPQPELIARAAELEAAVQARCEELAHAWPLDDLVVDFAWHDERVVIVDLHPWLAWCDSALFSWEEDAFESYSFRYLRA